MSALPPVITGMFSVSDLMREAAQRSIDVNPAREAAPNIETPSMSGMLIAEQVQPGLLISGSDLTYLVDNRLEAEMDRSIICGLLLDGAGNAMELQTHPPIAHTKGNAVVVGFGETTLCARPWQKGQRSRVVGLILKPVFFDRFGALVAEDELSVFRAFLEPGVHSATLPWSQRLIDLGEATLKEPYGGSLRSLFRETQALRFTLEIASLLQEENRIVRQMGRRAYDRVCEARQILDESLVDPPRMLDLARLVGVNVRTLQANFKTAFGSTIFGYVRNRRLEMARILIFDHGLGVAEAGYRVGFTNPSAFTAAYRRHFGKTPSATS